jgi:hypothetical protein
MNGRKNLIQGSAIANPASSAVSFTLKIFQNLLAFEKFDVLYLIHAVGIRSPSRCPKTALQSAQTGMS